MMSLGKNILFLAIWKCHNNPPPSQINPKPFFVFCNSRPQPNPGRWGMVGGGGGVLGRAS